MIHKIGIENFRVFKDYTEFELKPFTILTGPNNSGKSSFIKFLLLLKEGVEDLNFEQGKLHNLESFEKVLNWKNKSKELKFSFYFKDEYKFLFSYKKENLTNIKLFKNNSTLLFEYYQQINSSNENNIKNLHVIKNLNINYLVEKIYSIDIKTISYIDLTTILYEWDWKNIRGAKNLFKLSNEELKDVFAQLNRDGLLYEVYLYGVDVTEKYRNKLLEVQKIFFDQIKTDDFRFDGTRFRELSKIDKLKIIIEDIKDIYYFKQFLENKNPFDFGEEDFEIKYSPLGEFIFKQNVHTGNLDQFGDEEFINLFNANYLYPTFGMKLDFKELHYISANRGSQKRILSNKSENDIDEIILEFTKSKNIREDFINKAFQILGIDGKLNIERHENVISVVKIKFEDKEISLADLGYGFSQVIPIILKISNMVSRFNGPLVKSNLKGLMEISGVTLILEEPEANLHPNLQSKLAEVLVLANKEFGVNFIIETHSEYLIRKLQYLTAKNEIKTEDSIIYYFNADKYVSSTEKKIKEIKINDTGGLTDTFGPGFFDEATSLKFELMKLNQAQKN